jgi:tetratricopeptide (TPR) repeat protein
MAHMEAPISPIEAKILSHLTMKNFREGFRLFDIKFSAKTPPSPSFIHRCFAELNRHDAHLDGWKLLQQVKDWFKDDETITETYELARRIYYDHLLVKGNETLEKARQQSAVFEESLANIDALRRDKLAEENRNTLHSLYEKALKIYQEASDLIPEGLGAMTGMVRCHGLLGHQDRVEFLTRRIQEISEISSKAQETLETMLSGTATEEDLLAPPPDTPTLSAEETERMVMGRFHRLFAAAAYDELLQEIEAFLVANPQSPEALLLRIKTLVRQHRFQPAEQALNEALKTHPRHEGLLCYRLEFLEEKLRSLADGATGFLDNGLHLGARLGRKSFIRARHCLEQALTINPHDPRLLDQLFTCLMFLGQDKDAQQVKRTLVRLAPGFEPTFQRGSETSFCFLAGYAFLDAHDGQTVLEEFRRFRRTFLLPTAVGRAATRFYVLVSPRMVRGARRAGVSPSLMRLFLAPVRWTIRFFSPDETCS